MFNNMLRLVKPNNFLIPSVRMFSESNQTISSLDFENIKYNYSYVTNMINQPINISKSKREIIENEIEEVDRLAKVAAEHALRN